VERENMSRVLIFLARLIGFHFVPEDSKAAVMRLGMYNRARGPGFVWVAPLIERVENLIEVTMRLTTFTVEQVVSSDGIPFDFKLTVRYSFDPDSTSSRSIAAQLVRQPDHVLENIVRDYVDKSLRRTVARYIAEDICNGGPIAAIEQGVMEGLKVQVGHLGLAPMADSGVMIKEITPPDDYVETMVAAKGYEMILRVLTAYQAADVDQALLAEWVRNFKEAPPGVLSSLSDLLRSSKAKQSDEQ
jgi:regulator of protease activity HflC (stomatin/prohibitin superfamily)